MDNEWADWAFTGVGQSQSYTVRQPRKLVCDAFKSIWVKGRFDSPEFCRGCWVEFLLLVFFPRKRKTHQNIQKFREGLADRRGWRKEILPISPCPSEERGGHNSGELFFAVFWGPVRRQPPPANPFSAASKKHHSKGIL